MPAHSISTTTEDRDLILTCLIDAMPDKVFRAWTDPAWIVQWFTPPPWTTKSATIDLRPGGSTVVVMCSPDGQEFPNPGVYLEVIPNRRLVITDAYTTAWVPSAKPFLTMVLDFVEQDGKTLYTARVQHWTIADRESHEQMGFHPGWTTATEQLIALVTG